MTHISTMVLNRGMLEGFDFNINHSPSIVQMHFIFYIVSKSLKTVFINDYLIAAYRNNNEWGVEGIRLFSFDIGKIMDKYIADKKIIGSFEKQFINKFYPIDIIRARGQKDTNLKKSYLKNLRLLKKRYKKNSDFAFLIPVIYLPFKIAKLYAYFFSFLVRLFYKDKLDALNFLINKIRFFKM